MEPPELTIILVNYNCTTLVVECLKSLVTQTYQKFQVAIVDNSPGTAEFQEVKSHTQQFLTHFSILYFKPKYNLGYAGGNNYALRRIASPFYYLLNCDTELPPDSLGTAMTYFKDHPNVGMLGPKILYFEDPRYIWWAGAEIKPDSTFFSRHIGEGRLDKGQFDRILPTDYVCGAALFVRKEVIEKIGYLDEIFFMYHEEAEWNYRTHQAGFELIYYPPSQMLHKVQHKYNHKWSNFSHNAFLTYLYTRNKVIFSVWHYSLFEILRFFSININRSLFAALGKGFITKSPRFFIIQLRAVFIGTWIGWRRRTHQLCKTLMRTEMHYINTFTKQSRSTQKS